MMTSRRLLARRAVWLTLLASPTAGACYRYTPIDAGAAGGDDDVRVQVAPVAAARVATETGSYATTLDGRLSAYRGDSVALSLPVTSRSRNQTASVEGLRQSFYFSRAEVLSVTRREVDKGKTALVAIVGLAAASALVVSLTNLATADPAPDDGTIGPPPVSKNPRPVVRLRIPIP